MNNYLLKNTAKIYTSLLITACLLSWLGCLTAAAQGFDPENDVPLQFVAAQDGVLPGGSLDIAIVLDVPPDYHITSLETGLFYVEFDADGFTFTEAQSPQGTPYEGDDVFQGRVIVRATASAASDLELGDIDIKAAVGYQICVETGSRQCFFPVEKKVIIAVPVLSSASDITAINADL